MATTVANEVVGARASKSSFWTFKNITLKLHLWLGLASALFLVVLGITGAIIAFEPEADRWLHPSLWYVTPAAQTLPESQLIAAVEQRFAEARVRMVLLPRHADIVQVMTLGGPGNANALDQRSAHRVFVNPYDGAIVGDRTGVPRSQQVLAAIHQFHLHIAMGDFGTLILSIASAVLAAETILGLVLWWRLKRGTISFRGSWFRICFDAHNALGIYSALFVLLAALTGCIIGFEFVEPLVFKLMHSERLVTPRPPRSTPGAGAISVDQAMAIARQTIPEATVTTIQLPATPTASFQLGMRVPQEVNEDAHSNVWVDQYSGTVLKKQNFATDSPGYRAIRFNRSLHTGDVWGVTGHAIMGLTSLLLTIMVITGVVIWWKKLAV